MVDLDSYRRFYAEEIQFFAGLPAGPLIEAFAKVPREVFLGPGPWRIGLSSMAVTPDADPRHVYHNVAASLDAARGLNNGQPGSLAHWIYLLDLRPGNHVFHLGCGGGYYTAIMAEVVGPLGKIVASEVHPALAERAKAALVAYPNVTVFSGDGSTLDPGPCDAILVNAGLTHLLPHWLDRLREGGRLIAPLTIPFSAGALGASGQISPDMAAVWKASGSGVMVKIVREGGGFSAKVVSPVAIYSCENARDSQMEPLLGKAMATGMLAKIKSIRRDVHQQADACVLHRSEMCLSAVELTHV
ncbi:MAG TPA: methyltransferase domain-containing protein [Candidatus Angelobacter sp.]|nr:methyltransferase domain-containing protein [Candidatus Angelobacter sp.]